ncbi:MAG: FlgD immunoglobulin-like domain containing protein [Candidatus Eiseniibacteriota bacterium]
MTHSRLFLLLGVVAVLSLLLVIAPPMRSSEENRAPHASTPTLDLSQPGLVYADSTLTFLKRAQAIDPEIVASPPSFDSSTGLYTYAYAVTNRVGATSAIRHFALAPVPRPVSVTLPSDAWDYVYGFEERRDALLWTVIDAGPAPADWDSVSVWPSPFDIQPGQSIVGFSFKTPASPAMVSYYVQGFFAQPTSGGEAGGHPVLTLFQNSLTGTIVGPGSAVNVDPGPASTTIQFQPPVPNPTTGAVSVTLYLTESASVRLALFTVNGRLIRELMEGPRSSGFYSVTWDGMDDSGRRVGPGVYFYKLWLDGRPTGQRRVVVMD